MGVCCVVEEDVGVFSESNTDSVCDKVCWLRFVSLCVFVCVRVRLFERVSIRAVVRQRVDIPQ